MGKVELAVEIVVHALQRHHDLLAVAHHQGLVLEAKCQGLHVGMLPQLLHDGVGRRKVATVGEAYLQFGIKVGEQVGHQSLEAIEHAEGAHHSQRGNGHTACRNGRDDVDGVVALWRKEVAPGYEEPIIHLLNSSSMCWA